MNWPVNSEDRNLTEHVRVKIKRHSRGRNWLPRFLQKSKEANSSGSNSESYFWFDTAHVKRFPSNMKKSCSCSNMNWISQTLVLHNYNWLINNFYIPYSQYVFSLTEKTYSIILVWVMLRDLTWRRYFQDMKRGKEKRKI